MLSKAARVGQKRTAAQSRPVFQFAHKRRLAHVAQALPGTGRGVVLDRPGVGSYDTGKDLDLRSPAPQLDTGRGGNESDKQRGSPPGGGDFRVLLIDHAKHQEQQVVQAITRVVPGTDEAHARNCYSTAKQLGMAIVTTCLKEHAEFYAQQLYRMGCRTAIEPDSSV